MLKSVCVLNYILDDAPEKAVGNTDDFCLSLSLSVQPGPVINADYTHACVLRMLLDIVSSVK